MLDAVFARQVADILSLDYSDLTMDGVLDSADVPLFENEGGDLDGDGFVTALDWILFWIGKMFRIFSSIPFLLVLAVTLQANAENIATNGSFEDPDLGWSVIASSGVANVDVTSIWASDGNNSIELRSGPGTPTTLAFIGQEQPVGDISTLFELTFSFDAILDSSGVGENQFIYRLNDNDPNTRDPLFSAVIDLPDTGGVAQRFEFGPYTIPLLGSFPNDAYSADFGFAAYGRTDTAQMFLDNVIADYRAVPEPFCSFLLVLGIIPTLLKRRLD